MLRHDVSRSLASPKWAESEKVNSLKGKDVFLMHGVVLQNRHGAGSRYVSRETFCVKNLGAAEPPSR